jgi:copper transport protein
VSSAIARGLRRVLLMGAVGLPLSILLVGPAFAHAELESSDPADGALLRAAPARVVLSFTEPPDPDLSSVTVVDAAGQPVQTGPIERGSAPRSLVTPLGPDLPNGVYTVSWIVVSEADGHRTANAFAFGVGVDPAQSPVPSTPVEGSTGPTPLSVAGKVALYLGLVLAIGTAISGLWTIGPALPRRRDLSLSAGILAGVGAVGMLLAEGSALDVPLDTLLSSSTGRAYVWLLASAGALLVFSAGAAATRGRATLALMGVAAVATAVARASGGHAAAADPAWPQELTQSVHIIAIGVWIGAFVPILLLVRARRRGSGVPPLDEVRRFSRAAGWAVLVVIATGTVRVVDEAGGLAGVRDLLMDTSYGTALFVKVTLVVVLVGLGAYNRWRSIPRLANGEHLVSRVIGIEAVGAVAVLTTTAILTGLSPTPPPATGPVGPKGIGATGNDFATTMRVRLAATPGTAGPNDFEVEITDFDTGEPVPATAVSLRFEPVGRQVNGSQLELVRSATGSWTGHGTQLSLAGVWEVTVLAESGSRGTQVPLTLVTSVPGGQKVDTVSQAGVPDIITMTFSGGQQLQCYIDDGSEELHITAFDPAGDELPLSDVLVIATPEGGDPQVLDSTRFGAGHFTAEADVGTGTSRFDVVATGKDGAVLQGWFEQEL